MGEKDEVGGREHKEGQQRHWIGQREHMTVQRRKKVKLKGMRYKVKAEKHKGTTGLEGGKDICIFNMLSAVCMFPKQKNWRKNVRYELIKKS
jgi:hypothetical protein